MMLSSASYLRCHDFAPDTAVILLRYERVLSDGIVVGDFLAFTRAQFDDACSLCGVRAQMAIVLDPTIDEDYIRLNVAPVIAAGCFTRAKLKAQP